MAVIEVMRSAIADFHRSNAGDCAVTQRQGVSIAMECGQPCHFGLMLHMNVGLSASLIASVHSLSAEYAAKNIALSVSQGDSSGSLGGIAVIELVVDGDLDLGLWVDECEGRTKCAHDRGDWIESIKKEIVSSVSLMKSGHVDLRVAQMISDALNQTAMDSPCTEGEHSKRIH